MTGAAAVAVAAAAGATLDAECCINRVPTCCILLDTINNRYCCTSMCYPCSTSTSHVTRLELGDVLMCGYTGSDRVVMSARRTRVKLP